MKILSVFSKKMLRFNLAFAFTATISLNLLAQNSPVIQWEKTFGGNNQDVLNCIQQTSDGGYILGGTSNSGISGSKSQPAIGEDFWVVKVDGSGNKQWDKTFGGNNDDQLQSLQQTSDGGYILGGRSRSGTSGDKTQASQGGTDYWVIKIDNNGNKLWDKSFGGSNEDILLSILQTSDGGYILGGYSESGTSGDKTEPNKGNAYSNDFWIVKLSATGQKVWDKTFGGSHSENLFSLKQTADGGYILVGNSLSGVSGDKTQPSNGSWDGWIIKINSNGVKVWDKTFGGNGSESFYSSQQTSDGGFILGGWSDSGINGDKTQASSTT